MYETSELLFGRMNGPFDVATIAFTVLGALLLCVALLLIGRRHDVGWMLAVAAVLLPGVASAFTYLPVLLNSSAALLLFVAGAALTAVIAGGAAVYALLLFRKLPLSTPMTRTVVPRLFSGTDVVAPAAVAVVYTLASLLVVAAIFTGLHAPLSSVPWLAVLFNGLHAGLAPAALVGLAHRSRWVWFLFVVAAIAAIYSTVMSAQGSVLIFLYVAQAGLAIAGWQRWGTLTNNTTSATPRK